MRSKIELYRDLLEAMKVPRKVSHIMCKTKTNYNTFKTCLQELLDRNFCVETMAPKLPSAYTRRTEGNRSNRPTKLYIITRRGIEVLNHILEIEDELGLELAA